MPYYVYILRCSDQSYYVGLTSDINKRLEKHNSGKGASWTATRLPIKLVYKEKYEIKSEALNREQQLKKWSRAKKEALIKGDVELLRKLSKPHQNKMTNS
ncbi:MAG: GIY-YIG nuclease family protein [candidate division Zixibacteria bacterium]|nr:GIY-YIG nuclease family protein [candidate division Zixibacteria bacterium]